MSTTTARLIRIYNRLKRGPVSIEIISNWAKQAGINVSERQLYRDLNKLQHLKFAEGENVIEYTQEKNKKIWKLEYNEFTEPITQYDINSFFLFRNFIPDSIQKHRINSLEKFEQILYKNFSKNKYQHQIEANEMYLRRTNYKSILYGEKEHNHLDNLMWALQNKRTITILANEVNSSNIDFSKFPFPVKLYPYEMLFHDGQVHIAGLEATSGKLLIYLVNNDLNFELTNEVFNRPKLQKQYDEQVSIRFGITESVDNKVHHIKLEFSKDYGIATQKNFVHHSSTWKTLKNGNLQMNMKCTITRELIGYLGFSLDKVKVIQPKFLKDLIVKKLEDTLSLYEGKEVNETLANKDYLPLSPKE